MRSWLLLRNDRRSTISHGYTIVIWIYAFLLIKNCLIGLHRNREFIITQHPLEHSIMEFWQMMWDQNAQTIVMLTQCDEVRLLIIFTNH